MEKYFWREKNANFFLGKNEVIEPTKEELERELILKFAQKLDRIDVIFDRNAREDYFINDKKPKPNIENMSESEIQQKIGLNVVVDFIQVVRDICEFYKYDFKKLSSKSHNKITKEEIKRNIKNDINNLFIRQDIFDRINDIYQNAIYLANLLNLDLELIEQTRKEKEEKQGNFFNGKYVIK